MKSTNSQPIANASIKAVLFVLRVKPVGGFSSKRVSPTGSYRGKGEGGGMKGAGVSGKVRERKK